MAVIKWNGGIELDIKSVIFIISFAFAAGGGWMKLNAIDAKLDAHLATIEVRVIEHDKLMELVRQHSQRLDVCCPFGGMKP